MAWGMGNNDHAVCHPIWFVLCVVLGVMPWLVSSVSSWLRVFRRRAVCSHGAAFLLTPCSHISPRGVFSKCPARYLVQTLSSARPSHFD